MNESLTESPFIPVWAREYHKDNQYYFYNGTSMEPLFRPGDLLCVRIPVWPDIRTGDVVVILRGIIPNALRHVVHRVISVKPQYLITQGDNNFKPDLDEVTSADLVGIVFAYERQGKVHPVCGGIRGEILSSLIHSRNTIWSLIKRMGWRIYRIVRTSGLVAKLWRPVICRMRVMTDKGPLIKYCHRNLTVALWWPEEKRFDVHKPFDLIIPNPDELK